MSGKQRQEATIAVPSKDKDTKEKGEDDKSTKEQPIIADNVKDPGGEDLSEEDKALQDRLTLFVERLLDNDIEISNTALESLKDEIRTSTSSMTSVPKPLKFLKPHYDRIKEFYNEMTDVSRKVTFSDLMSVLAMTMEAPETRLCLRYRLQAGETAIDPWGAQYVKHLAAEIRMEMTDRLAAEEDAEKLDGLIDMKDIMAVSESLVRFYMQNNSEPDACDTLMEVEALDMIEKYCEDLNHLRTCEYLRSCAQYQPYPEDTHIFQICFDLCFKFKSYYHALRYALKLDSKKLVHRVMKACKKDKTQLRQCAYLLGWHQYGYDEDEEVEDDMKIEEDEDDEEDDEDDDDMPEISEIIANQPLSDAFHHLAADLDVVDPKDPETDVFKEQLVTDVQQIISAKKSLAVTYVNAFVNAGYGKDKYMVSGVNKDADDWIAKNKERGQMASVASIGTIMLWDEEAVNRVDRYFESEQNQIRAGAFLAIGLACSGMRSEAGLGYALLSKPAAGTGKAKTPLERVAATFGLGMAYAGQENEDVYEVLSDLVSTEQGDTLSSIAALCCGLVYVGTCNEDVSNLILGDLMERVEAGPEKLDDPLYLLNALGLGLLFLQRQEDVETTLEAIEVFNELSPKFAKTLKVTLNAMAYAGTGNVLKVQEFLEVVGEHFDEEDAKKAEDEKKSGESGNATAAQQANDPRTALQRQLAAAQGLGTGGGAGGAGEGKNDEDEKKEEVNDHRYFQSIATLGIALCSMGEDLGSEMTLRMFNHLIQYGNVRVKRAVPLGLSLLCVSNPKLEVMDILSKLSHDADGQVSQGAILGLGIIGAGTNNARIAGMLRSLTAYYAKDADHLYLVRVAQGLVHTGKGLMTLQPFHSDRFLMSKVALCGILTVLFAAIDLSDTLLGSKHYLMFAFVMALKPRMLVTLNEKLKPLKTSVRVGQALDVVGQAGRPKSITGFQTHDTPVLLGYQDRAELATDEYLSATPVLEGFAVLRPNPEAEAKKRKER